MQLIEMNWRPNDRVLRQFGAGCSAFLPMLAWWLTTETRVSEILSGEEGVWDAGNIGIVAFSAVVGAVFGGVAAVRPQVLRLPYLAASLLAFPVGLLVSQALMVLMYYGIFMPIGMLFKLAGRDVLHRRFDSNANTYWTPKRQPAGIESYFRQS
jgi:hypothetical protein